MADRPEYDYIVYERRGPIVVVTIDRPEVRNALHNDAHRELQDAFARFAADSDLAVAILTGAGDKAFCAGNDLKVTASRHREMGGGPAVNPDRPAFGGITNDLHRTKPIIAAVNGLALGGGFELVLACDLAIASDEAVFGLPEVKRGLIAAAGGLHRLPRQLPLKQAMGIILTGRQISAPEALALGLINEVVSASEVMPAALRWADQIIDGSGVSIELSMRTVLESLELPLDEALAGDRERIEWLRQFEDFYEGPRAFAERRKPVWTGRLLKQPDPTVA